MRSRDRAVRRPSRALAVLSVFVTAVALGAVAVTPAAAAPTSEPVTDRHPERDWMGSQVAKHASANRGTRPAASAAVASTPGLDVSGYQGDVDWGSVAGNGARFAIVKATEGTYYTNPHFDQQYTGSYDAGLVHGAYHFATPDTSTGAAQADYFIAHGGGWSQDGRTLPGMLDIEWDPYGSACYGLSQSAMASWVQSFSDEYHARTTRWPIIYTATSWWSQCVGTSGDFSANSPLNLACYCSTPGTMPYAWTYQTIWQFADSGTFPGDQDRFNGDLSRVTALATG